MNIEGIDIKDIEFGEPIEEKEPNYRDGYIRGIYRARNIIDNQQQEIERLKEREKKLQESFSDWKKGIEKERKYWLCERTDCCGRIKDSKKYSSLYQENKRLNNKLKDIKSQLDYLETYSSKEDVFEDMKRRLDRIDKIIGSDKE